jgi:uncharacterized protein
MSHRQLSPSKLERRETATERQVRTFALSIKASGEDGAVEGYGSVFGVRDAYADVIANGAFAASLEAHKAAGTMPAMLWQHDSSEPIGVWSEMVEDEKGLRIKGRLALDTVRGKEAHALLKMGALNGLSIGFISKEWMYDRDSDVRTLTQVDLWEVSLVTFPANGHARITGVKAGEAGAVQTLKDAERCLRDAGFSADAARAFVAQVRRISPDQRDAGGVGAATAAAERLLRSLRSN